MRIAIGDTVSVSINTAMVTLFDAATVLHVPQATGESWIFRDAEGNVYYVSEGCTVTKKAKPQKDSQQL